MLAQMQRIIAMGIPSASVEAWLGDLSRCDERLLNQRFFAEFMQIFCIYGLNGHKTAKNTEFSCVFDIIPLCTAKYTLFIVQCSIIRY